MQTLKCTVREKKIGFFFFFFFILFWNIPAPAYGSREPGLRNMMLYMLKSLSPIEGTRNTYLS